MSVMADITLFVLLLNWSNIIWYCRMFPPYHITGTDALFLHFYHMWQHYYLHLFMYIQLFHIDIIIQTKCCYTNQKWQSLYNWKNLDWLLHSTLPTVYPFFQAFCYQNLFCFCFFFFACNENTNNCIFKQLNWREKTQHSIFSFFLSL